MKPKKDYKEYNKSFFRKIAPIYDYVEFFLGNLREKVADRIKGNNIKVLDVACGTGNQSIAFSKKGLSVVGIDLSPDMLKYANKKIKPSYKLKFICKDAIKIPYKDSEFDVSSISLGLHDMPELTGIKILKEMIRTTKKHGKIIIIDYNTPKKGFIGWLASIIVKTWESKYYDDFMKVGLNHYLKKVNLKEISKQKYLFGIIQIVECDY